MPLPQNDARRAALVKGAARAKIKAMVNLGACTGCEVCISVCPVPTCIEKFGEDPSSFGVYVNYDICIGCQLCSKECPWDTIRMVPAASVSGHTTSLDSQYSHAHPLFLKPELVPEEVRTFVGKEPSQDSAISGLFEKPNPAFPAR